MQILHTSGLCRWGAIDLLTQFSQNLSRRCPSLLLITSPMTLTFQFTNQGAQRLHLHHQQGGPHPWQPHPLPAAKGPQRALCRLQEPPPPREQGHPQDPDYLGLHATGMNCAVTTYIVLKLKIERLHCVSIMSFNFPLLLLSFWALLPRG